MRKGTSEIKWLPAGLRYRDLGQMSKYSSNLRRQLLYLRVCRLTCEFTARWYASFAVAARRLPEQRRNSRAQPAC